MSLADDVQALEESYEGVREELRELEQRYADMEQQLDDVEQDLETKIQQLNQLQEFKDWVALAYPVVVKDYESVKLIEEVAHEHG